MKVSPKVMVVDDEEFNLEILVRQLNKANYLTVPATDGREAIDYLQAHPSDIDVILLDKMMPNMNGIQFMNKIRENTRLREIPVIMQTASIGADAVIEGMEAGVFYYLTKPFESKVMLAVVNSALRERLNRQKFRESIAKGKIQLGIIDKLSSRIQTIDEANSTALMISSQFTHSERVTIILCELLQNAIEHGNLGIGYQDKSFFLAEGTINSEIDRRLTSLENSEKYVSIDFIKDETTSRIVIKDQGKGFDYKRYFDFDPTRATDPNGRGIARANAILSQSFDESGKSLGKLQYNDIGNEVEIIIGTSAK